MKLPANSTILFQGDSITDCGRQGAPDGLGGGYAALVRGLLAAKLPGQAFKIVNRGVGGDRTVELLARWQADCLDLKPDLLSIMIGVNDVWRLRGDWNGQKFVSFEEYSANLRKLVESAKASGIKRLALMSPSAIEDNKAADLSAHLDQRAAFVKSLAAEFKAVYVPIREEQKRVLELYPEVKWTADGCHPSAAGHALFAQLWLNAVKPSL